MRGALGLLALWSAGSTAVRAETFQNSYISFDLPPGWTCKLEETEYVCSDASVKGATAAIIIMAAKQQGPMDRLDAYEDEMSAPRPVKDAAGNPIGRYSRVEFVRQEPINGSTWIHGRQFESEVPGYNTDYFAAIKGHVAILVTFSALRSSFDAEFAKFYPTMASISATPSAPTK